MKLLICLFLIFNICYSFTSVHKPIQTKLNVLITNSKNKNIKSDFLKYINEDNNGNNSNIFVCPSTLEPLQLKKRIYGLVSESYYLNPLTNSKYPVVNNIFTDFTIKEEINKPIWTQSIREIFNKNFFQLPVISAIYERGYRQNFERAGFPGIQLEFEEALQLFTAVNSSVVMDLSCGSGFMTRNFIKSNKFSRIISADLSLTMIAETYRLIKAENLTLPEIIRCDSARLPLADNSIDAIHAGAAMHCWPRVENALAEIYRVLKPTGVFYASTFLSSAYSLPNSSRSSYNNGNIIIGGEYFNVFESIDLLKDLTNNAGFKEGQVIVRKEGNGCAIIKAIKAPINYESEKIKKIFKL